MIISLIFKALVWAVAGVSFVAVALTTLLAVPLGRLPTLESLSRTLRIVDRADLPAIGRFPARDGTPLGVRHYPAQKAGVARVAIVVHGASASSVAVHALARALAARGVETYAPDIRGHGVSGTRGDIAYVGQLEDDLADLVGEIRKTHPSAPLTLIGHSSGGAFVLRVAASPIQTLFERAVLLAPYLGADAPTTRRDSGGWAQADRPRVIGLAWMSRLGLTGPESLPEPALAVAADSKMILSNTYTFRLMSNFATTDYRRDLAATTRPLTIFAGAADELMLASRYQSAVGDRVPVHLFDGVDHMAIVSDATAVAAIAHDVATFDPAH